jgi:hypothetical protein
MTGNELIIKHPHSSIGMHDNNNLTPMNESIIKMIVYCKLWKDK